MMILLGVVYLKSVHCNEVSVASRRSVARVKGINEAKLPKHWPVVELMTVVRFFVIFACN